MKDRDLIYFPTIEFFTFGFIEKFALGITVNRSYPCSSGCINLITCLIDFCWQITEIETWLCLQWPSVKPLLLKTCLSSSNWRNLLSVFFSHFHRIIALVLFFLLCSSNFFLMLPHIWTFLLLFRLREFDTQFHLVIPNELNLQIFPLFLTNKISTTVAHLRSYTPVKTADVTARSHRWIMSYFYHLT